MKQLVLAIAIAACGGTSKSSPPVSGPAPAPAPAPAATEPAPASKSGEVSPGADALAQAELAEQYDAGKKIYVEKKCATCHGDHGEGNPKNPPVIGPSAFPETAPPKAKLRKGVAFQTAKDVLDFVHAKMPLKNPGTLSDKDAEAVTAWMLSESKVSIDKPLHANNAAAIKLR